MTLMPMTIQKPALDWEKGTATFMPQREEMIVGTAMTTVKLVKTFIVMFRLLLMMLANASIVPLIMSR